VSIGHRTRSGKGGQRKSSMFVFRRPFVKRFALCYRTVVCPVLSFPVCLSFCLDRQTDRQTDGGVLWPNGWMDDDATWYGGRPHPRRHCVRWGPSSPQKGTTSPPLFGPCPLWPNSRLSQQLLSSCLVLCFVCTSCFLAGEVCERGVAIVQLGSKRF